MFRGYWPTLEELSTLRDISVNGGQLTPQLQRQILEDEARAAAKRIDPIFQDQEWAA